ncbi:hypothetical protein K438DRAFT_1966322 [Mycena galopus ATCC 62051]|nr:hypothetical protein K438DRAFT_1966322 [Mycena galopus ATCC 62051]
MAIEIINIREGVEKGPTLDMSAEVLKGLRSSTTGAKSLPSMLLYDERGLRLFDEAITNATQYYLFAAEKEILKEKSDEIVAAMHPGGLRANEIVLELGAGPLGKTSHILLALSHLVKDKHTVPPITYYALDLEERSLDDTLSKISLSEVGKSLQGKVSTRGLCATYDQGLKFAESGALHAYNAVDQLSRTSNPLTSDTTLSSSSARDPSITAILPDYVSPPLHLVFLGSSLGNFSRTDGADFLRSFPLRPGSGDTLLLGIDHDNDKALIEEAYNEDEGYTRRFIMNALPNAGRVLGDETLFDEEKWEITTLLNVRRHRGIDTTLTSPLGRHVASVMAKRDHTVVVPSTKEIISFSQGEKVQIAQSLKFSEVDAYTLFTESGFRPIRRWIDSKSRYSLWLLERPPFAFPLLSSPRAGSSGSELALKQPYSQSPFGVPSVLDWENLWAAWDYVTQRIVPSSTLMQKPTDEISLFHLGHSPAFLDMHLSRLLQEPHTEPEAFQTIFARGFDSKHEDWPTLVSVQEFQARVRVRLLKLYADIDAGTRSMTRRVGRVLFVTFEYQALHVENILCMLLQREGTGPFPPPGFTPPPWASLARTRNSPPPPEPSTVTLGPTKVTLGHDDDEAKDEALADDVAGHEFGWDNEHPKREVHVGAFRIEWRPVTNGQFLKYCISQSAGEPALALPGSWVEVDGKMHVRTLYGPVPLEIAQNWPVLASYRSLSQYAEAQGGRLPSEAELRLFFDKFDLGYEGGANVGFRNWHPVPATTGGARSGGKGGNGGVWEWTSTVFDNYEGFKPSVVYPGYSADFFDGAHQVVLGGSYATIPRIADRKSMRNYRNQRTDTWVSGRIVYDV